MKPKIQKIILLLIIALAMPGITNTFSFGHFGSNQIIASDGDGSGSDKGGTSTKDGGGTKGGGSGGTLVDAAIELIKTIFSGMGGGTNSTST